MKGRQDEVITVPTEQKDKAVKKQPKKRLRDIMEAIEEWISWHVDSIVVLSVTALLISIASAILSISRLIQYLISH